MAWDTCVTCVLSDAYVAGIAGRIRCDRVASPLVRPGDSLLFAEGAGGPAKNPHIAPP